MQEISKFLLKNKYLLFFSLYFLFRISILNINSAEWGDSYRILRATNYLEFGSYPEDEKRPPLFSFLLLIKLVSDPIISSRIIMMFISFLVLGFFYLLLKEISYKISENQRFLSLLFLALNPLFLYWSIRIYADTVYLLFLLIGFYIYYLYLNSSKRFYLVLLSIICLLSILTRFEGYLLTASVILGLLMQQKRKFDILFFVLPFTLMFILVFNNFNIFHYKNPLSSSYVDEAGSRTLNLKEILNFFFQFIFLLGNLFTIYFIGFNSNSVIKFFKNNLILFVSFGIHLGLAFFWFAAVPRLFIATLPILSLLFVISIDSFFNRTIKISWLSYLKSFWKKENLHFLILFLLIGAYLLGQYYLKLPYLLTKYRFIGVIILLNFFMIPLITNHFRKSLISLLLVSNVIWSIFFISIESKSYKVLNEAVSYFKNNYNFEGKLLTNDISSLTRYYFEDKFAYSSKIESGRTFEDDIISKNIDYVLITNEHNPDISFTPSKHPYLTVLKEFRETINGVSFFTILAKVSNK